MDRRDFIKAAAVASVGTATASHATPIELGTDDSLVTSAIGDDAIAKLAKSFDFSKYVELLNEIYPSSGGGKQVKPSSKLAGMTSTGGGSDDNTAVEELQPIDTGAVKLLGGKANDRLLYNPFEVEYLLSTAETHIRVCLQLREQAQQIELLWLASRSEVLLEQALHAFSRAMTNVMAEHENKIVGTMYQPTVTSSSVTGSSSTEATLFRQTKKNLSISYVEAMEIVTKGKVAAGTLPGGGSNLNHRFRLVKEEFDRRLEEAYHRALAASFGMRHIFGVADLSLPPVEDIGYTVALASWISEAQIRLDRLYFGRTQSTVILPLNRGTGFGLLEKTVFENQRTAGQFAFAITEDNLSVGTRKLKNPRLLGLDLYAWAPLSSGEGTALKFRQADFVRFLVEFPQNEIRDGGTQVWKSPSQLLIHSTGYPEGKIEPERRPEITNLDPLGDWRLSTEQTSYFGNPVADILQNVLLALRLSHDIG